MMYKKKIEEQRHAQNTRQSIKSEANAAKQKRKRKPRPYSVYRQQNVTKAKPQNLITLSRTEAQNSVDYILQLLDQIGHSTRLKYIYQVRGIVREYNCSEKLFVSANPTQSSFSYRHIGSVAQNHGAQLHVSY